MQLDSKSTIISPFAASHWLGREVRLDVDPPGGSVTPPTASDEKEEVVELVAATQRETDAVRMLRDERGSLLQAIRQYDLQYAAISAMSDDQSRVCCR